MKFYPYRFFANLCAFIILFVSFVFQGGQGGNLIELTIILTILFLTFFFSAALTGFKGAFFAFLVAFIGLYNASYKKQIERVSKYAILFVLLSSIIPVTQGAILISENLQDLDAVGHGISIIMLGFLYSPLIAVWLFIGCKGINEF